MDAPLATDSAAPLARRVFRIAAVYGALTLLPMYLAEGAIGRDAPPAITHPEFFYGFLGVALAWQWLFWRIGGEPVRLRAAMLPAILEKLAYGGAALALWASGRLATPGLVFGLIDLGFAAGFALALRATPRSRR